MGYVTWKIDKFLENIDLYFFKFIYEAKRRGLHITLSNI